MASESNYAALNDRPAFDPYLVQKQFLAKRHGGTGQFLDLAGRGQLALLCNRFSCVGGGVASYGYFAMRREDAEAVRDGGDVKVTLEAHGERVEYEKLAYVTATSLAPCGFGGGPDDVFVVEVADRRNLGLMRSANIDSPGQEAFNVVAGAWGPLKFYEETLKDGQPYDWQDMLDALWPPWLSDTSAALVDDLPDFHPINFDFRESSAYQAVAAVLSRLGKRLAHEPDGTYSAYTIGAESFRDQDNERLYRKYGAALDEDVETLDPEGTYYPKGVRVNFQRTSTLPGCESSVTREAGQWYTDLIHMETLDAEDDLPDGVQTMDAYHQIWDDLPAWTNPFTGDIYNLQQIKDRAKERRRDYYRRLSAPDDRIQRVYSALVPFRVSGKIQAVTWAQLPHRGGAWMTHVLNFPWRELRREGGLWVPTPAESPTAPWQWKALPLHPPRTAIIRLAGSGGGGGGGGDPPPPPPPVDPDAKKKCYVDCVAQGFDSTFCAALCGVAVSVGVLVDPSGITSGGVEAAADDKTCTYKAGEQIANNPKGCVWTIQAGVSVLTPESDIAIGHLQGWDDVAGRPVYFADLGPIKIDCDGDGIPDIILTRGPDGWGPSNTAQPPPGGGTTPPVTPTPSPTDPTAGAGFNGAFVTIGNGGGAGGGGFGGGP